MKIFEKINGFVTQYLIWIVIGVTAVSLAFPHAFMWAAVSITTILQFVMFTMGLTMKPQDFSEVMKKPWQIFGVVFAQYVFMPFSAFAIAQLLQLSPEIAIGLILVGAVPSGTSSNVIAYLANGDLPLSISATSVSTVIAPFVTPLLLSLYGGAYMDIEFWTMFISIVEVVLAPVIIGLIISYFFGERTQKIKRVLPTFSTLAVMLALAGTVAVNQESLVGSGTGVILVIIAVTLHNMSGYGMSYLVCKVTKRNIPVMRTIAVEIGTKNTGLAASLGLAHFTPAASMAAAAGAIMHTMCGTIYASICRKKDKQQEELQEQTAQASTSI
jgi:BASS family bile acid:Na+ symporter